MSRHKTNGHRSSQLFCQANTHKHNKQYSDKQMQSISPPSTFSSSYYLLSQEHDQHNNTMKHRHTLTAPLTKSAPTSPHRDPRRRTVGCDGGDDDAFLRAGSFWSFFKKAEVPKPHRRKVSLPTIELTRSDSTDSGDTCTTADSSNCDGDATRHVNLFDLIDEEFVVKNCTPQQVAAPATPQGKHRKRRSILDMIDRIDLLEGDDEDESSSFMTERSYPRGVYVVPPTESHTKGNVGFVAADALQWREC